MRTQLFARRRTHAARLLVLVTVVSVGSARQPQGGDSAGVTSDASALRYGVVAKNLDCLFCHTVVDSAQRFYEADPAHYGTFERVKVGALETLAIRHDMFASSPRAIDDFDADSYLAGSLHVRGQVTDQAGLPIRDWNALTFGSFAFDADGLLVQDPFGEMTTVPFEPALSPAPPGENLYLEYPEELADMPDGILPTSLAGPFADDGGIDRETGLPSLVGAGNKVVDDGEFYAAALQARGAIVAGTISLVPHGTVVTKQAELLQLLLVGNRASVHGTIDGNLVLVGTVNDPITIDGTVAVDGDALLAGFVLGRGTLLVRGNVFVPDDLEYLDGTLPPGGGGARTFGIAQDGTPNGLGLAVGGNILIGDFARPATLQPDGTLQPPSPMAFVSGGLLPEGRGLAEWAFVLAEMARFNRAEWARTQPVLPGPGEADLAPDHWTVSNAVANGGSYDPGHLPRYYGFGPGDEVPIYNRGGLYWDANLGAWIVPEDAAMPLSWRSDLLTIADPADPRDPLLYDGQGRPTAVVMHVTPIGGWITPFLHQLAGAFFESQHAIGEPLAVDALLYTRNAIFALANRDTPAQGSMRINGALVASDLAVLAPGRKDLAGAPGTVPDSPFAIGLRLNYDERVIDFLEE